MNEITGIVVQRERTHHCYFRHKSTRQALPRCGAVAGVDACANAERSRGGSPKNLCASDLSSAASRASRSAKRAALSAALTRQRPASTSCAATDRVRFAMTANRPPRIALGKVAGRLKRRRGTSGAPYPSGRFLMQKVRILLALPRGLEPLFSP